MAAAVASNIVVSTIASSSTSSELASVTDWPRSLTASASLLTSCPTRRLNIHAYARAPTTGVWYYHVDVMLLGAHDDAEVQFYSVPRRYNEFLALYTQVRALVGTSGGQAIDQMPLFPSKELMSPTILGLLWRSTTSIVVLEERRQQFEALLQWIERHPVARTSSAFQEFLGQPPETQDGYVSLKEYSSPHWLSALHQQLAKDREFRRRRRSSAGSATSTASSTPRAGSVRVLQMETATGPPPHQRRAVAHKENRKAELDRLRRKTRRQSKKPTCIARRRRGNTFVKLV